MDWHYHPGDSFSTNAVSDLADTKSPEDPKNFGLGAAIMSDIAPKKNRRSSGSSSGPTTALPYVAGRQTAKPADPRHRGISASDTNSLVHLDRVAHPDPVKQKVPIKPGTSLSTFNEQPQFNPYKHPDRAERKAPDRFEQPAIQREWYDDDPRAAAPPTRMSNRIQKNNIKPAREHNTDNEEEAALSDNRSVFQVAAMTKRQETNKFRNPAMTAPLNLVPHVKQFGELEYGSQYGYPARTTRSAAKPKEKKAPITIDLLDSDDDAVAMTKAHKPSPFMQGFSAAPYQPPIPMFTAKDLFISKPVFVGVHTVIMGLLRYPDTDSLSSLTVSQVGKKLVYNVTFQRNDVHYSEDMDDDHIDYVLCGELGNKFNYLAFLPRDTMQLKSISIGPDRLLNPKLKLQEPTPFGASSSASANKLPPTQGKYVVLVIEREEFSAFMKNYDANLAGNGKKGPRRPNTDNQHKYVVNLWDTKIMDEEALFLRAAHEKEFDPMISQSARSTRRRTRAFDDIDYSDPENRKTYVIYPLDPEALDAVTICKGDMKRLEPGVYFNDNLIDLKIKHVLFNLADTDPTKRSKIHAFSCHFYSKLTEGNLAPAGAHGLVSRWTKNVNIFEQDFVFFPINLVSHWSLAVLVRAGQLWDLPAVAKAEEADYFTEDVKEVPAESTPWDNISGNQPCLIFLDSLSMHPHAKIGKRLASYVYHERLARRADRELGPDIEEKDFIPLIKIIRCQAPQQHNGYDCGVFVTRYAKMIVDRWPSSTKEDLEDRFAGQFASEFNQKDIDQERVTFKAMLDELHVLWVDQRAKSGLDVEPVVEQPPAPVENNANMEGDRIEDSSTSDEEDAAAARNNVKAAQRSDPNAEAAPEEPAPDSAMDVDVDEVADATIEGIFSQGNHHDATQEEAEGEEEPPASDITSDDGEDGYATRMNVEGVEEAEQQQVKTAEREVDGGADEERKQGEDDSSESTVKAKRYASGGTPVSSKKKKRGERGGSWREVTSLLDRLT